MTIVHGQFFKKIKFLESRIIGREDSLKDIAEELSKYEFTRFIIKPNRSACHGLAHTFKIIKNDD